MNIIANTQQLERLAVLLKEIFPIMLAKSEEECSLGDWTHPCGKPMDIAGEACVHPCFIQQGLKLELTSPTFNSYTTATALDMFFGEGSYNEVFHTNTFLHSDREEVVLREKRLTVFLNEAVVDIPLQRCYNTNQYTIFDTFMESIE